MKTVKTALLAFLIVLITGCGQVEDNNAKDSSTAMELPAGKISVINYWASWCKPCIKEIPELNQLAAKHPDIAVIGINFDGIAGEELDIELKKFKLEYHVADKAFGKRLGIALPSVLPTTIILASDGSILHTLVGPQTEASLMALIDAAKS